MTTEQMRHAAEGRDYWYEYVRVNGYALQPNRDGLKRLSRLLDLQASYLSRRITCYLES